MVYRVTDLPLERWRRWESGSCRLDQEEQVWPSQQLRKYSRKIRCIHTHTHMHAHARTHACADIHTHSFTPTHLALLAFSRSAASPSTAAIPLHHCHHCPSSLAAAHLDSFWPSSVLCLSLADLEWVRGIMCACVGWDGGTKPVLIFQVRDFPTWWVLKSGRRKVPKLPPILILQRVQQF